MNVSKDYEVNIPPLKIFLGINLKLAQFLFSLLDWYQPEMEELSEAINMKLHGV